MSLFSESCIKKEDEIMSSSLEIIIKKTIYSLPSAWVRVVCKVALYSFMTAVRALMMIM